MRICDIPELWSGDPTHAALIEEGRAFTFAELAAERDRVAGSLAALGVRRGDRVMVVGENGALLVALLFALAKLDAWMVDTNARLSAREVEAIREHSGARIAIYLGRASPEARAHGERHGAREAALGAWETALVSIADARVKPEPVPQAESERTAALIYTSGTTGDPKAVMLSHGNLLFIGESSARLRHLTRADRVYGVLPISHVYGLASVCLGSLTAGACLQLQPRFSAGALARSLAVDGITVMQGVPAMYAKLLGHLAETGQSFHAPHLRFLYAGGSPLDPALKAAVESASGRTLHNGYGLTEASPTIAHTRQESPRTDCSVGPPIPGVEVRIVDARGRDVQPGEPGELWCRGPNVMQGYYRNAALTTAAIRPGGWLDTGDIARADASGALFIVGRTREVIIRSGFNVYPAEVEAVLNAHPEVSQSAVVGREVEGDEEVVAYVELAPGARTSVMALAAHAAAGLAPYKRPAEIVLLASLPAAANGKVLKHQLKKMAQGAVPVRP